MIYKKLTFFIKKRDENKNFIRIITFLNCFFLLCIVELYYVKVNTMHIGYEKGFHGNNLIGILK
jgi:hypothetical protein